MSTIWEHTLGSTAGLTQVCGQHTVLIGRRGEAQITPGIYRRAVDSYLVVDVRPCYAPADADETDHIAALAIGSRLRVEAGKVSVPGGNAEAMLHNHQPPVARTSVRRRDHPICSGTHRVAILRRNIHSGVECAFTTERVQPFAETPADVHNPRPERWRETGIA